MMSACLNQKRGKGGDGGEKVVVAVKASKEISRAALVWALTHVVQPGDCITLLAVVPSHGSGRKLWGFPIFAGDCASGHKRLQYGTTLDQKSDITDYCSQMMVQLHNVYDPTKVNIKIKIVSGSPCGAVAAESNRVQASWVVLDRQLKHEEKRCMEELQCNIVIMKNSQAKVLRLNLVGSSEAESQASCKLLPEFEKSPAKASKHTGDISVSICKPTATPNSSPESGTQFTATEAGTSSVSGSDPGTSPFFVPETKDMFKKDEMIALKQDRNLVVTSSDSDNDSLSPSTTVEFQPWVAEILRAGCASSKQVEEISKRLDDKTHISIAQAPLDRFLKLDKEARISSMSYRSDLDSSGDVREAVSLARNAPPGPPPLCSICQHKAPVFGKPPRWFSYAELELATGGFSKANFLAEGGFGSVHRGVLPDGQVVAVKQHKLASSQGDHEFCSEVEVLSCAQHRNVVMLIGFCVEDRRRLLVYEYICNGSLDSHLYGHNGELLEWSSRQKIAVGAARGLRYLHEECRVGCIVHRDMRPNNILITHDFEPLVGDFGLARWQPDGDLGVETRIIGTFGYLAPEYAQSGQITEKADVYSFGVVLLELVTGRKAVDINRPKGQQCLTEWARPLLEASSISELVDPRLGNHYSKHEVYLMLNAASLCVRHDPHVRPRMSQVLRILEGDMVVEPNCISSPSYEAGNRFKAGNRSEQMLLDLQRQHQMHHQQCSSSDLEALESFSGKRSHEALKAAYRHRDKARWSSCHDDLSP